MHIINNKNVYKITLPTSQSRSGIIGGPRVMVASATGGPEVRGRRISPRSRGRGSRMGIAGIVVRMVRVWGVGATERRGALIASREV